MVGADLSGIQLRVLAHYINDPQYTELVCSKDKGNDIHTFNRDIISTVHGTDRDGAKTFIYAMLLGAQGPKLGSIIGGTDTEGYRAKDALFNRIPGFKRVQKMCAAAARRGYMIGLDGRRVPIRSQHTALACYLQNGESVIMKQALRFMRERIHFPWHLLAVVHDEAQSETLKEHAKELGEIKVKCFEDSGKFFDLRCPVTGEFKIGSTWKDCH
jgi:DNA polymerase-1